MTRLWMLPEGIGETLPPASWAVEDFRHAALQGWRARGFELVMPPAVEHLDSLLTGAGADLAAQTFTLTDPASGRLLGVSADMTPQTARIAARQYGGRAEVRLCYFGPVLRVAADALGGSRAPIQAGCEIFGCAGRRADLEILDILVETLRLAGITDTVLDLGHAGIYRALLAGAGLREDDEAELFEVLQRKSRPDLADMTAAGRLPGALAGRLDGLLDLHGGIEVIEHARDWLAGQGGQAHGPLPAVAAEAVCAALDDLDAVVAHLATHPARPALHVDLGELRGYRYQTGLVFAAYAPGHGREMARGGRYDGAGAAFAPGGLGRPATGFSVDVLELLRLGHGAGSPAGVATRQATASSTFN